MVRNRRKQERIRRQLEWLERSGQPAGGEHDDRADDGQADDDDQAGRCGHSVHTFAPAAHPRRYLP